MDDNKLTLTKILLTHAHLDHVFGLKGLLDFYDVPFFIHEKEYDKDGVLKFFEALEKDVNFEFHRIIFQNKPLLSFLEKGDSKSYHAAVDTVIEKMAEHRYPKIARAPIKPAQQHTQQPARQKAIHLKMEKAE